MNKAIKFLNKDRIRVYPRLFFIGIWSIFLINIFLHVGWVGGLGQVIGIDYLLFYSTGSIYRSDPTSIYNFDAQHTVQRSLISPTELPAINPYFNPPYVALPHSWLTVLPYPISLIAWSILSIIFVILTVAILYTHLPSSIKRAGFTPLQMAIVIFSFFPLMEGFLAGQNHTLTLLLVSMITIFSISERWYLAGLTAGLLLYKPQFILGYLIIWLFSKKFKALVSFGVIAAIWVGYFVLKNGIDLFGDYMIVSSMLLKLPYDQGFPVYLLVTPYGLLASLLPESLWIYVYGFIQLVLVLSSGALAWFAWRTRNLNGESMAYLYSLAILFPLLVTPYALLHDLLILIPLFVIFSKVQPSHKLLALVVFVYFGGLLLPLVGYVTNLAIPALLTLSIMALFLKFQGTLIPQKINKEDEYYLGREI